MDNNFVGVLLSALVTLIGTVGGIAVSGRLTAYRIEQLEKKVDKHNTVIERTYALEKNQELFCEKLKVANHRIDDLEKEAETN